MRGRGQQFVLTQCRRSSRSAPRLLIALHCDYIGGVISGDPVSGMISGACDGDGISGSGDGAGTSGLSPGICSISGCGVPGDGISGGEWVWFSGASDMRISVSKNGMTSNTARRSQCVVSRPISASCPCPQAAATGQLYRAGENLTQRKPAGCMLNNSAAAAPLLPLPLRAGSVRTALNAMCGTARQERRNNPRERCNAAPRQLPNAACRYN